MDLHHCGVETDVLAASVDSFCSEFEGLTEVVFQDLARGLRAADTDDQVRVNTLSLGQKRSLGQTGSYLTRNARAAYVCTWDIPVG